MHDSPRYILPTTLKPAREETRQKLLICYFALAFILFSSSVFAQTWIVKPIRKGSRIYVEYYSVDDQGVKNGVYILKNHKGDIVTIAQYRLGLLSGEFWGELHLRMGIVYQQGAYRFGKKEGLWKEKYYFAVNEAIQLASIEEAGFYVDGYRTGAWSDGYGNIKIYKEGVLVDTRPRALPKRNISSVIPKVAVQQVQVD